MYPVLKHSANPTVHEITSILAQYPASVLRTKVELVYAVGNGADLSPCNRTKAVPMSIGAQTERIRFDNTPISHDASESR